MRRAIQVKKTSEALETALKNEKGTNWSMNAYLLPTANASGH